MKSFLTNIILRIVSSQGISNGDAIWRPKRGPTSCYLPSELRLQPFDHRKRSCGCRQLLWTFRCPEDLRRNTEDELHIKPLKIDWTFWCHGVNGFYKDMPAWQRRQRAYQRNQIARDAGQWRNAS